MFAEDIWIKVLAIRASIHTHQICYMNKSTRPPTQYTCWSCSAMETHAVKLCSYWVSKELVTFTHYAPLPLVTLLCNFMWLNCCGSCTLSLCNNTTYSWSSGIREGREEIPETTSQHLNSKIKKFGPFIIAKIFLAFDSMSGYSRKMLSIDSRFRKIEQ